MTATYVVDLLVDGADEYELVRMAPPVNAKAYDPDDNQVPVSGSIENQSTEVHWTLVKNDIPARTQVQIGRAAASKTPPGAGGMMFVDRVEGASPANGGDEEPKKMVFIMMIDFLDIVDLRHKEYVEGADARALRVNMDANQDGNISGTEVEGYNLFMEERLSGQLSTSDMTLDGVGPTDVIVMVNHRDAEGPADSEPLSSSR